MTKKSRYEEMSDKQLIEIISPGINIPGYYITYPQRKAAELLRKRGYRVSLQTGKVTSKTSKSKSFPFETPKDKIADMIHDGYSFKDALKHTKRAFKKLNYTITKDEEKYLRKTFRR